MHVPAPRQQLERHADVGGRADLHVGAAGSPVAEQPGELGRARLVGDEQQRAVARVPPTLGRHTAEILREMRLSDAEIERAVTSGTVRT